MTMRRDNQVKMWAKGEAQSRGVQLNAADCVAQRFLSDLHAKPYPGRARQIFNGAVTACKNSCISRVALNLLPAKDPVGTFVYFVFDIADYFI